MVLWHQFSSQVMEASWHNGQLGHNTDPLPSTLIRLSQYGHHCSIKSPPDPCCTFQHLLINFMCIALPRKDNLLQMSSYMPRNQTALLQHSKENDLLLVSLCCKINFLFVQTVREDWHHLKSSLSLLWLKMSHVTINKNCYPKCTWNTGSARLLEKKQKTVCFLF